MKKIQALFLALSFVLLGYSASLHAEDIDIYTSNASNVGTPNVLFVIDNGADFDASANIGCSNYSDGTNGVPSLGTNKTSGVLQCSLVNAISSLPSSGAVNIGIMVSNANNYATTQATTDITKGGYHEACASGGVGGCLLRKLTLMDSAGKTNLITFIKGWQLTGQSDANSFTIKVNSSVQASTMQETWAYYNGKTGMSGTVYSPSILANGCQKNFVVYISNTQKNPSSSEYNSATTALAASQVGATTAQKTEITGSLKFSPAVCSTTTTYTLAAGQNLADEWARLMYQQDGGAAGNQNVQNIITYTIGVQSSGNQCSTDTYGLVASMAKVGGGKFFNTSSVSDLTTALETVLNEVQAVNSVFSSASLPVSVNAEGSYLNQIFLGMFRPDPNGNPRWLGNLKQYQLVTDSSGTLVLGDAQGNAAISSSGTGFISPSAQSFWTYKDTTKAPDDATTGGFFVNNPEGTPATAFDLPDGEVVEKGGVAQQMRKENLKNDWSTTAGSSTNPRRLYTYCPSGASCVADLTNSANAFTTTNSGISTSAFGATTSLPISQIVRSGSTVTVTTQAAHGFSVGTAVTIQGSSETAYNGNVTVATVPSSTTFTVTGFNDYPTTPSANTYTVAPQSASTPVSIATLTRATHTSGSNTTETVTVTTSAAHGFVTGDSVTISGTTNYNGTYAVTVVDSTHFTFTATISPTPTASGWSAQLSSAAYPQITGASLSNPSSGTITVTKTGMVVWVGQTVTITSTSGGSNSKYNGIYTIASVTSSTNSFDATCVSGCNLNGHVGSETGTVDYDYTAKTVSLSRVATTDSITVTATGATSAAFGASSGDTRTLVISKSGAATNESAYGFTGTVTCTASGCTSFTYTASTSPSATGTASSNNTMTVAKAGASGSVNLAAGAITRSGTTATITGLTSNNFTNGQAVTISSTGASLSSESAYEGNWKLTCTAPCTTATFGPVTLSPNTPITNSGMSVFSGSTPPDKTSVIRWVRGEDNYGDEAGPGNGVTVRPSIHGDVLHSRPLVLNYGDTRGIVVFYGSNDGVFRAVNGNQSTAISGVAAGDELWGLILPDHFSLLNRQRTNSPALKFPSTLLTSAQSKDYFIDGPTGVYQKLKADTSIDTAYIYLTMRRGGRFMYAVDVSTPTTPTVKWKISTTSTGFSELGQTWSRPKLTLLQSSTYQGTPVMIFGGGYDPNEDSEPPVTDTMGRGIYIINAVTGDLIWSATPTCTTSSTCRNVPGMTYSIPSEVTFVDRDGDGFTDKLYFTDVGGNVWRADVTDANSANWTVTLLAKLGCDTGTCSSGTTPRKFFFPPSVLPVLAGGTTGSYDLISIGSGDREHPLKSTASGSSYNVVNRFYTIIDKGTSLGTPVTHDITQATLFDATSTQWDGTGDGFYMTFATGEKEVNAPTAVNGFIFFATNKPANQDATCIANLGIATAYAVSPFLGTVTTNQLAGGGLPPSAVSGVILINTTDPSTGQTTTSQEKFCIGCGVGGLDSNTGSGSGGNQGGDCAAALGQCTPVSSVPKNMKRTYWYRK